MQSAVAEFKRLQAMNLDDGGRLKCWLRSEAARISRIIYKATNVYSRNRA